MAQRRSGRRGERLLLHHCAGLERLTAGVRRPAGERLVLHLGDDLTRRLLCALSGDHALGAALYRGF